MFKNGDSKKPIKYKNQKLIEGKNIFFEMCNTRLANYNDTAQKTIDDLEGIKVVNISDINTIVEQYWSNDSL